jgi:hypothetical protein
VYGTGFGGGRVDVDLLKSDVDLIAACLRLKGVQGVLQKSAEPSSHDDEEGGAD